MGRNRIINENMLEFSKKVERFVKYNSLTHKEAGKLLGVSGQSIHSYINGYYVPSSDKWPQMEQIMENYTKPNEQRTTELLEALMEYQDCTGVKTSQLAKHLGICTKRLYKWASGEVLISEKYTRIIHQLLEIETKEL